MGTSISSYFINIKAILNEVKKPVNLILLISVGMYINLITELQT